MGSSGTMAAPGAAGSARSGSARHICSHNALPLQQVRAAALLILPPHPLATLLGLSRVWLLFFFFGERDGCTASRRQVAASRRYRRGEEGKVTLGFEDLQVLVLLNGSSGHL